MQAQDRLERRGAVLEERVGLGGVGLAVDLRPDEQVAVCHAKAEGQPVDQAASVGGVRHDELLGALLVTDVDRVGEDARFAGRLQAHQAVRDAVARVLPRIAGGHEEGAADGQGERRGVLADQAHVEARAGVAGGQVRGRRVGHPRRGRAGVAAIDDAEGDVEGEARAVEQDERPAGVQERLRADDRGAARPVGVLERERAGRVLGHHADRRARIAAQVQRVEREPLAPSLGGVEAIGVEARDVLRASSGGSERRSEGCRDQEGLFHGSVAEEPMWVTPVKC